MHDVAAMRLALLNRIVASLIFVQAGVGNP
jgi:hypothetical protein